MKRHCRKREEIERLLKKNQVLRQKPKSRRRSGDVRLNEEDEEHEIFAALSMAQGLHKLLEEINQQLQKLDGIQDTVSDVCAIFLKLEARIQILENSQETASRDIENLRTGSSDVVKKSMGSAESLEKHQNEINC